RYPHRENSRFNNSIRWVAAALLWTRLRSTPLSFRADGQFEHRYRLVAAAPLGLQARKRDAHAHHAGNQYGGAEQNLRDREVLPVLRKPRAVFKVYVNPIDHQRRGTQ